MEGMTDEQLQEALEHDEAIKGAMSLAMDDGKRDPFVRVALACIQSMIQIMDPEIVEKQDCFEEWKAQIEWLIDTAAQALKMSPIDPSSSCSNPGSQVIR